MKISKRKYIFFGKEYIEIKTVFVSHENKTLLLFTYSVS